MISRKTEPDELVDYLPRSVTSGVGYVHYSTIERTRREQIVPGSGRKKRFRVWEARNWRQRLAQAKPKEWTKDPFFLCHLLALAQYQDWKRDPSKSHTHTVRTSLAYWLIYSSITLILIISSHAFS